MEYLILGIAILLLYFLIKAYRAYVQEPERPEEGKAHLPKFFGITGIISVVLFVIFASCSAYLREPIWVTGLFLIFAAIGALLAIAHINCRISYDAEGFVVKNLLGIRRKYTYDQVTGIRELPQERCIYVGKRRVTVENAVVGGEEFVDWVKKKYKTVHQGQEIPLVQPEIKHDPFRGNIKYADKVLCNYTWSTVILIGLVILAVVFVYFCPGTIQNTSELTVSFAACDVYEEKVVLTATNRQAHVIRYIDKQFDVRQIQKICDRKTEVTVYAKAITPSAAESYYVVKAIVHNGKYLLSFEETNRLHSKEWWPLILIALGILLLWVVYMQVSIIVVRDPQRFGKASALYFFRQSYLKD